MISKDANGDRWTVTTLKEYADAKFQTLESSAKEARALSEKALERNEIFLTKTDYIARHEALEQRINTLSATPWATYGAVGMILIAIVGGFWSQVSNRFDALEKRDDEQRHLIERLEDKFREGHWEKEFLALIEQLKKIEHK